MRSKRTVRRYHPLDLLVSYFDLQSPPIKLILIMLSYILSGIILGLDDGVTSASSDISIEFTPFTEAIYTNHTFSSKFFDRSTGGITGFYDTASSSPSRYYFISDYRKGNVAVNVTSPIDIVSTIYDENSKIFNNANNIISKELPYDQFVGNESSFKNNFGNGLQSCTNPINYDILICYDMQVEFETNLMIYCLIFFNDETNPQWSKRIKVNSKDISIYPLSFTIECLHDSYLILFETFEFYDQAPDTKYTLLDLYGNIKMYVQSMLCTHQ